MAVEKKGPDDLRLERELFMGSAITEMMKCINRMKQGDFDCEAKLVEGSGMEELVKGFNSMIESVRSLMQQTREQNEALKEREEELRNTVKRLRQAMVELKELDAMKTQFLATASHEIKTPMTPLLIEAEMLEKENFGKLNKKQKHAVSVIKRNIKRLNKLITSMLEMSRSMRGKLALNKKPADLNKLVETAVSTVEAEAQEKSVKVEFKKAEGLELECDKDKVVEVLINLVDNAIKFTGSGGRVLVETGRSGREVFACVKDTGQGIDKKDLKKLFKPFTQLEDVSTRKTKGTGLGLSICKQIVEAHGGKIWAESRGKGKGTRFCFSLPSA
jgi:signal transduction histidine kinase